MGNFFGNIGDRSIDAFRVSWVGWIFAFFIAGALILARRRVAGLRVAKFNQEV